MGLNYSVNLYFPTARLADALAATGAYAPPEPAESTPVRLPDGTVALVPFTSGFKNDLVGLELGGGELRLDTSILFPADDAVRAYAHLPAVSVDGREHFPIGYYYLTVRTGCLFAEFSFTAATSGMSRLFVASGAVRACFAGLLRAAGGLAGWLDRETFEFYRLDDPEATFDPEPAARDAAVVEAGGEADRLAEAVARGLGAAVPHRRIDPRWRTADVVDLARVVASAGGSGSAPILADALLDAGCDDDLVLGHFRRPGAHARGCWVVDQLAGSVRPDRC
jgi:hypothetical protein